MKIYTIKKNIKEIIDFIKNAFVFFFPFIFIIGWLISVGLYFATLKKYNPQFTIYDGLKSILIGMFMVICILVIFYFGYKLWIKVEQKLIAIQAFFILRRKRKKGFLEFLNIVLHDKKIQKYLLNYYKITKKFHTSVYGKYRNLSQKKLNEAVIFALRRQATAEVKYLLTSPKLSRHADIHYKNDTLLIDSCMFGHFDLVKYLLSSSELKDHSCINTRNNEAFKTAYLNERIDIIRYFLYDLNIEINEDLK